MKVAVSLQQILWITKEIEVDEKDIKKINPTNLSIPLLPTDKPAVKNIIDIFDEDCNLLASFGRE